MRIKEFDVGQVFYNSNGYLTIVLFKTHSYVGLLNYNGTYYDAHFSSKFEYSDELPNTTTKEFFEEFPKQKLNKDTLKVFNRYRNRLLKEEILNVNLLLLIL